MNCGSMGASSEGVSGSSMTARSPTIVIASLSMSMYFFAIKVERYRKQHGSYPSSLRDVGDSVAGLQYSLLDDRPRHGMVQLCREQGIALFCYGTVAGGFLSGKYGREQEREDHQCAEGECADRVQQR